MLVPEQAQYFPAATGFGRLECFGQASTNVQAHRNDQQSECKGHSPAPRRELLPGQPQRQRESDQSRGTDGNSLARVLPADEQTAAVRGRTFEQQGSCRPDLSAQRQALHQARNDQDQRGEQADAGVSRCQGQPEGADGHQRNGQHQCRSPAGPISISTDQHATQGPRQEADAKVANVNSRLAKALSVGKNVRPT